MIYLQHYTHVTKHRQGAADTIPRFDRQRAAGKDRVEMWWACRWNICTRTILIVSLGLVRLTATQFCRRSVYSKWLIANNYPVIKPFFSWVSNLRGTSSMLKRKLPGWRRTATGPEKVSATKRSVQQSRRRSQESMPSVALRWFDGSVNKSCIEMRTCWLKNWMEEIAKWMESTCVKTCFETFTQTMFWFRLTRHII